MAGKRKQYTAEFKFKVVARSLAAGHDTRRGLPKVLGDLFDGEPVAASPATTRARDLSQEAPIRPVAAKRRV